MVKKYMLVLAALAGLMLVGCGKQPIEAALQGVSNIVVIKDEEPVKVAASNEYDTLIQEGVVIRVSELSYMEWEDGRQGYRNTGVVSLPRRSIRVKLYADWLDLAGDEIQLPQLDMANARQLLQDGSSLQDTANATVKYEPDMQKANARIIYEWFPPADAQAPDAIKLPFRFNGENGRQVDITVEAKIKNYPW